MSQPRPTPKVDDDPTLDGTAAPSQSTPLGDLVRSLASAPPQRRGGVSLSPGDRVGRSFRIEEEIGAGGMGVVYGVVDVDLGRHVAIKLCRGEVARDRVTRLLREAKAMASLSHPNILTVYEVGTHAGSVFVAMEYVDGNLGESVEPPRSSSAAVRPRPRAWCCGAGTPRQSPRSVGPTRRGRSRPVFGPPRQRSDRRLTSSLERRA